MRIKIFLFAMVSIAFLFAQSGYVRTPDQLYNSINNKKPTGDEIFQDADSLPTFVELGGFMPDPGNQGTLGSCAAWAAGYACKTYQEALDKGIDPKDSINQISPLFIYNLVNNGEIKGSAFPDVFDVMEKYGCATLSTMPYSGNYLKVPEKIAYKEAEANRIKNYKRLDHGNGLNYSIRSALSSGQPIIVAMRTYKNFRTLKNEILMELEGEQLGGHGMCIIGYDDISRTFKLINSWGIKWGENGYCRISYDLMQTMCMEAYVIYDLKERTEDETDNNIIDTPEGLLSSEGSYEDIVILTWIPVKNAESYVIYRSNNKEEKLEKLGGSFSSSYTDDTVLDNVKYIYSIRAVNDNDISGYSEISCGWASKEDIGIPSDVVCELKYAFPHISWKPVNRAEGYNIYRWQNDNENYRLIAISDDEEFIDTSIPKKRLKDGTFYYLLTAFRGNEESKTGRMVKANYYAINDEDFNYDPFLYELNKDKILPEYEQKYFTKKISTPDYYDPGYMERFFEDARKAEQEAFKRMKEQESNIFDKFRKMEEENNKRFK